MLLRRSTGVLSPPVCLCRPVAIAPGFAALARMPSPFQRRGGPRAGRAGGGVVLGGGAVGGYSPEREFRGPEATGGWGGGGEVGQRRAGRRGGAPARGAPR